MTIHTGKFRTILAFSSKLGQFRTKIEDPENMRNCVWGGGGLYVALTPQAVRQRTITFRANREAITLGSNG